MQKKFPQEYKQECDEILRQMARVLYRAQRKVDDAAYRTALENIKKHE